MTAPQAPPPVSFTARLLAEVALGAAEAHADNQHVWNGIPMGRRSLRESTSHGRKYNAVIPDELAQYAPLFPQFERLSDRLDDDTSRDLLARVIAYRLMGQRAVRLPLNTPAYHKMLADLDAIARPTDLATSYRRGGQVADPLPLSEFDLRPQGFDLTAIGQADHVAAEFLLGHYRCPGIGVTVRPGDVVIDGGAGWGAAALHFAHDVGPEGQVHAFDFEPRNLALLDQALARNPHLKERVEVIQLALWDQSDLAIAYHPNGPASRLTPATEMAGQTATDTVTIDDYVQENGLERVDFIKMDIEGSEPRALRGARNTIRRFRPRLAICLDYQPHHYVEIPRLISEYLPEYRFRLGHFSISQGDTVLLAAPDPAGKQRSM